MWRERGMEEEKKRWRKADIGKDGEKQITRERKEWN